MTLVQSAGVMSPFKALQRRQASSHALPPGQM